MYGPQINGAYGTVRLNPGRVGNRSGQSDFPTRVRPRLPGPGRVRTLRYILRPDSDRVRSLAFQSLVGPVYFKDLLGKSRVCLRVWSDYPIEMGSAQIKLKLGRFPFQWVVTPSRLIGGPGAATTTNRHWADLVPLTGGRTADGQPCRY